MGMLGVSTAWYLVKHFVLVACFCPRQAAIPRCFHPPGLKNMSMQLLCLSEAALRGALSPHVLV